MATITAKAFRMNGTNREFIQSFIVEQIPEDTKFVLASSEGYLFFNEEPSLSVDGQLRMPRMMIVSYYDIEYESE